MAYGPCKSVDDLLAISRYWPEAAEKMRKYLVAGKSLVAISKAAAHSAGPAKYPRCERVSPPAKSATVAT